MKGRMFSPKNLGDLRTSRRGRCCKKLGGSDPWICGELKHPPQTSHMGRKAACQKRLKHVENVCFYVMYGIQWPDLTVNSSLVAFASPKRC